MVAQREGVRFEFIHAFMDERSPFSVADFARQRRRWFGGLWLCVLAPELPLISRLVMGTFMLLWSLSWLCITMVYLNFIVPTGTPVWLAVVGGVSFFYYVSLYILGYLRTFEPRKEGWVRYLGRFALQIVFIPIFSVMEAAGVLYGLISPPRDFFVVQKEIQ
jgi:egghead protein (zeste-white 4 protein)